ncbi:MAG: glycoside hydrolase family 15 protein [Gammaproteobacteria bacterium]|nr:glycoside hydrolase family 15 protein [Candidatus Thioaporhodococcus sediminis]TNF51644.1 MAG: glycoside hydrolase family 15 protein [Gammaproteobacteria bacterium]
MTTADQRVNLELGVIGNGTLAALVDARATILWCCFPRLDGDPLFCALLGGTQPYRPQEADNGGYFAVEPACGLGSSRQRYQLNSAVLATLIEDEEGNQAEVIDFAPRFHQYDRIFRPPTLVRRITPVKGLPRLILRVRPRFAYGEERPQLSLGSNHIRYASHSGAVRLTTDAPLAYVVEETPFFLDRPLHFILGAEESLTAGIAETARSFLERTLDHWHGWVRSLSIPFEWQDEVIRAAITLKLCSFEETGAIVAALTTSIPEAPGTERNWDYRFCWLRDAYFVVTALNRLGATRSMEEYLGYIADIVGDSDNRRLRPCYGITRRGDLQERVAPALAGYRGMGPVRVGNQAYLQVQNDVYGSVILAATHAFFDRRLPLAGDQVLFERLEELGRLAVAVFDQPDAGPWELRNKPAVHTFSAVICWAGCDRLARIATRLGLAERAGQWRREADRLHEEISRRAWNPELGCFVATFGGDHLDASLLLLCDLDFLTADDPRFAATVDAIGSQLMRGGLLLRYSVEDDFGRPETAFTICTFWYIEALAALGRREEARRLFSILLERRNALGLLSEDIQPETGELWGNYPQTYSLVGLIHCAMRLSLSWEEAL